MHRSLRYVLPILLPAAFVLTYAGTSAHASSVLVVDDNLTQCPNAGFTTINAAVAAASAGDTIQVCAGNYGETVMVDKSLTFAGAKAGVDARSHRSNAAAESVVNSINGGFTIAGGVNGVTIDGFTIQGAGSDAVSAVGIAAFQGSSGLTVVNNVIRDNLEGMNFQNPDANQPALIRHNNFINNNNGTTAEGGTGAFISNGPANNTSLLQNRFAGHRETAINFAGSGTDHSVGLVVNGNSSVNDSTFVVATNSDNALVDGNAVSYSGNTNGTAILDFGSNNNLRVISNSIKNGAGVKTTGIKLADFSGTPSNGTTVTGNTVVGRYFGIRIQGAYTSALINQNVVKSSTSVGILVEAGSNNALTRNKVSLTTGLFACEDDTTGPLTAGTANTWTRDAGNGGPSSPAGICSV